MNPFKNGVLPCEMDLDEDEAIEKMWYIVSGCLSTIYPQSMKGQPVSTLVISQARSRVTAELKGAKGYCGSLLGDCFSGGLIDVWVENLLLDNAEPHTSTFSATLRLQVVERILNKWPVFCRIAAYIAQKTVTESISLNVVMTAALNRKLVIPLFQDVTPRIMESLELMRSDPAADLTLVQCARNVCIAASVGSDDPAGFMKEYFLNVYVESACHHFSRVSSNLVTQTTIGEFVEWIRESLEQESLCAQRIPLSECDVDHTIREILRGIVRPHLQRRVVGRDLDALIERRDAVTLRAIGDICCKADCGESFRIALEDGFEANFLRASESGNEHDVILQLEYEHRDCRALCALLDGTDSINLVLFSALRRAIVNLQCKNPPIFVNRALAYRVNDVMRKKTLDDDQWDFVIESTRHLASALHENDVFVEVYRGLLEIRLLSWDASMLEREVTMFKCLKACVCNPLIGSLYEMIMEATKQPLVPNFPPEVSLEAANLNNGCVIDSNFAVRLLNNAYWSLLLHSEASFPTAVKPLLRHFEEMHNFNQSQRSLCWRLQASRGTATVSFRHGDRDIVGDGVQLALLHRLSSGSASLEKLMCEGFSASTIIAMVRCKVLTESENCVRIARVINDRRRRIDLPLVNVVPPLEKSSIVMLRESQVDAAIVRCMKSSKSLSFTDLKQRVHGLLAGRFEVTHAFLKRRVEYLMVNEFVKRDDTNHSILIFVA